MNKQYKQFNFFGSVVVMAESQKAAERQLLKVMAKNAIGCSFSLSPPQAPVSAELLALPDKLRKRHETVRNQEWTYRDAYDESADELESVLSRMQGSQWQPIETAPKDGTLILLGKQDDKDWPLRCRRWINGSFGHWRGHDGDDATHWMPLPAPPQEGE